MRVVDWVREGEQRLADRHRGPGGRRRTVGGRVLVVKDGHAHDALSRGVAQVGGLQLGRQLSLPLVATILEPNLDLRLGEVKRRSQAGTLGAAQIAFHIEGGFELEDLAAGEDGARLLLAACGLLLGTLGARLPVL